MKKIFTLAALMMVVISASAAKSWPNSASKYPTSSRLVAKYPAIPKFPKFPSWPKAAEPTEPVGSCTGN